MHGIIRTDTLIRDLGHGVKVERLADFNPQLGAYAMTRPTNWPGVSRTRYFKHESSALRAAGRHMNKEREA